MLLSGAAAMAILIPSLLLIGLMLGARFKVLIMIPAIGSGFIAVLAAGIAHNDSASAILLALARVWTCLQIGYLGGIITRPASTERHPRGAALQAKSVR